MDWRGLSTVGFSLFGRTQAGRTSWKSKRRRVLIWYRIVTTDTVVLCDLFSMGLR